MKPETFLDLITTELAREGQAARFLMGLAKGNADAVVKVLCTLPETSTKVVDAFATHPRYDFRKMAAHSPRISPNAFRKLLFNDLGVDVQIAAAGSRYIPADIRRELIETFVTDHRIMESFLKSHYSVVQEDYYSPCTPEEALECVKKNHSLATYVIANSFIPDNICLQVIDVIRDKFEPLELTAPHMLSQYLYRDESVGCGDVSAEVMEKIAEIALAMLDTGHPLSARQFLREVANRKNTGVALLKRLLLIKDKDIRENARYSLQWSHKFSDDRLQTLMDQVEFGDALVG